MHGNIPYLFDFLFCPFVHLLLLKSSMNNYVAWGLACGGKCSSMRIVGLISCAYIFDGFSTDFYDFVLFVLVLRSETRTIS